MIIKTKTAVAKPLPHEAAIQAAIEALTLTKDCTFDDVRQKLVSDAVIDDGNEIPDGHIHQVAINNSFEVEVKYD